MVRIRPIGRNLLIHSVTVYPHQRNADPANQWFPDQPSSTVSYTIDHVRLQPVSQNLAINGVQGVSGNVLQGINYRLFIDYTNSVWQTSDHPVPAVQDTVVFHGERREVKQVSAVYALDTHPHHWEVLLT